MAADVQKMQEKLDKLRRNEAQMTPVQKKQYAKNLQAFKKQICAEADELVKDFLFGSLQVLNGDEAKGEEIMKKAMQIIHLNSGQKQMDEAVRILFRRYSVFGFLDALCRIHTEIWYKAYGPYWVSKTRKDADGLLRNTLLDEIWGESFYWKDEWREWVSDSGRSVTIMLPPTAELLEAYYKEEVQYAGKIR